MDVPGKHFPQLTGAGQNASYTGTAVEFTERHTFTRHGKAWGAAHTGPGIRFICDSDAIDDPDHKGFWTPLWLWNRLRHETYKDNRESEIQYLDKMSETADAPAPGDAKPTKKPPEVKNYFTMRLGRSSRCTTNWKYLCLRPTEEAIIARYMLKHGNVSAPSAAPPSTSPDPSSSDAAASTAPSSRARPARRPPATPPTHPPPTRSVASVCRCSSAPVFSRTRHTLHE